MVHEKTTIVAVDDEPSILEALKRLLADHNVFCFASGKEALQHISEANNTIDIVISDFRMPEMDGLEFLELIKSKSPKTLRVLLSGHIDITHLVTAINNEIIHRFFLKPWDNDVLKAQILEVQTQKKLIDKNTRLNELAITDPITGLNNHRYFQQELLNQIHNHSKNNSSLSLLMVDVDHFKSFNDRYGHPEGDKTLKAISERLAKNIPKGALLFRYGGEEFSILLPNTVAKDAKIFAESLRKNFEEEPFKGSVERPIYITISIGLAQYPIHSNNAENLIICADRALYQAKRQGRNQTVVALM